MSQYIISGKERKLKKKYLHNLKYYVKMFWFYEDINNVHGIGMDENDCHEILNEKRKEIEILENELSKTSN